MLLKRTQMVESALMGGFCYRALVSAKDARNVTCHNRIKTPPLYFIRGKPKNLSRFRAFGCRAYLYLNEASTYLEARAVEGMNLGFSQENSGHVICIPSWKKTMTTNRVRFDRSINPYRKQSVIDSDVKDRLEYQLRVEFPVTREAYG